MPRNLTPLNLLLSFDEDDVPYLLEKNISKIDSLNLINAIYVDFIDTSYIVSFDIEKHKKIALKTYKNNSKRFKNSNFLLAYLRKHCQNVKIIQFNNIEV